MFTPSPKAIKLTVPLKKIICVGNPMEDPYLVIATNILEVIMEPWIEPKPEPPELLVMLLLPNEINRIIRLISQAYMSSLPSIPFSMSDRLPNMIIADTFPISCMVWNVQGAGSHSFISALKVLVLTHNPVVLVLVKTHMGGSCFENCKHSKLLWSLSH